MPPATLPILTFHALDDAATPTAVRRDVFAGMVRRLAAEGRSSVGPEAALAVARGEAAATPRLPVLFTFDDGYASVRAAAESLAEHGFTATLFLAPALIGRPEIFPGDPICPRQPALTWDEVRALVRLGFTVGSHAFDHVDLRTRDDAALRDQLVRSRGVLEDRLGAPVRTLAYPFGGVDARVARAAAEVYDAAFTTRFARVARGADPHLLPRLDGWYLRFLARRGSLDAPHVRAYLALRAALRHVRAAATGAPA